VDKDPSVKLLAFRIHRLAEKLENLPMVKRAGLHFDFDEGSHDSSDVSDGSHGGDDDETPMVVTDKLVFVCVCVIVKLLDMNYLVCLSIMNCLVN
jgi:hypothetical protein